MCKEWNKIKNWINKHNAYWSKFTEKIVNMVQLSSRYFVGLLKGTVLKGVIASAASCNDNAYAHWGNLGELHSRQAKIGANLP